MILLPQPRKGFDQVAWGAFGVGALGLITALVLLFVEWFVYWPAVIGAAALVAGVVGLARSRRYISGRGPAIAGIVCGAATVVLIAGEAALAALAAG